MEKTFQFQSRLLSSIRGNHRTKSPLVLLNKMKGLTNRIFLQCDKEMMFIGKPEDIILLCNELFLIAGLLGVDLGLAVRKKFPGFCPYCDQPSCQCGLVKPNPHHPWDGPIPAESSLLDLQKLIVEIYPPERHNLEYQVRKLLEEIKESQEAIESALLIEMQDELADVFSRLAPLAHTLKLSLL